MFQLKGIWIVDREKKKIILARIFPTSFFKEVKIDDKAFLRGFTSITEGESNYAIFPLQKMWPFVSINIGNISYITLPRVENSSSKRNLKVETFVKNPINELNITLLPEITGSFRVLNHISARYIKLNKSLGKTILKYMQMYISQSFPFGRPTLSSPDNVHEILTKKFPSNANITKTQSSWKIHPQFVKKQKVSFTIVEVMRTVQVDDKALKKIGIKHTDVFCNGELKCTSELNGSASISFVLEGSQYVHNLVVSNYIQNVPKLPDKPLPFNVSLRPDNNPFQICKYQVRNIKRSPIRGIFQMKELDSNSIKFLLQLRTDNSKFSLTYCNIEFPFPNRNSIESYKFENHFGVITVPNPKKKDMLVWNIGTRFQKQEISLKGVIYFSKGTNVKKQKSEILDSFLMGHNMYVNLNFRIRDYVASGMRVSNLTTTPASKINIFGVQKELEGKDIKIWNSLGEVRYSKSPID